MSRKYRDSDLERVFRLVQDGTRIKDISAQLQINPGEVNSMYNAALRRTQPHYQRRMQSAKSRQGKRVMIAQPPVEQTSFKRPPAVYSNRRPYDIN